MKKPSSRGASIWPTRSSKYSLVPRNQKRVRAGRRKRVDEGTRWLSTSGRDEDDSNSKSRFSSLVNAERQATIPSGEIYPEWGISQSRRSTRSVADKRRFGNPGNGMRSNQRKRKRGVDPPKNESGATGGVSRSSSDASRRCVNSGNGRLIAVMNFHHCQPGIGFSAI